MTAISLGAPRVGATVRAVASGSTSRARHGWIAAGHAAISRDGNISRVPGRMVRTATKARFGAGVGALQSAHRRRRGRYITATAREDSERAEGCHQPETLERLWSNIAPVAGSTTAGTGETGRVLAHDPGSLPGAIALVAGTTVGAGMLALPAVCQQSGFVPSTCTLAACWLYMICSGLLLLEVNLDTMCESGGGGVSLISMTDRTLGKGGTRFAWCAYVFLHYALLVAYISRVGEIVGDAVDLDRSICSIAFAAGLGGFVYAAPDKVLEKANNALVFAVIGTFLPLLYIAGESVDPANLIEVHDWVVSFLYLVCSRVRNWTDVVFCLTS